MRFPTLSISAVIVLAHLGVYSCDTHHNDFDVVEDVTVDVTGIAGTGFDARFEDDDRSQTVTGVVPFSADFNDQASFFRAVVNKNSSGAAQVCVKIATS